MKQITALILTAALLFAFAACNGEKQTETITKSTTETTTSAENTSNTERREEQSTTEVPEGQTSTGSETNNSTNSMYSSSTQTNNTQEAQTNNEINIPSDKAGIVAYYNSALNTTPQLKRVSYTRTLTTCKVNALGFSVDVYNDENVKKYANENHKKTNANDLPQLTQAMVKSASSKVDGNTVTLQIALTDSLADADPQPGEGGYVGTLNSQQTKDLIVDMALTLVGSLVSSVDITEISFDLIKGTMHITIDKNTGKLQKVFFSAMESVQGKAKVNRFLPGTAALSIDLAAEYKPI